jgi:imidazolonepropionase-like amidohydrolase
MSATKWGGEIMGMPKELGLIKEGYLADLLIVEGDPTKEIRLMQDRDKLLVIMKDGVYHKAPHMVQQRPTSAKPDKVAAVWDLVGSSL